MARRVSSADALFPAHAGVIPDWYNAYKKPNTVPRTRGGDPMPTQKAMELGLCSPHTRG